MKDETKIWLQYADENFESAKMLPCLSGCLPKRWIGDHDIRATHLLRSAVRTSDIVVGGDSGHIPASTDVSHPIARYRKHHGSSDDALGGNRIGMV
jgi:hypothetical protein